VYYNSTVTTLQSKRQFGIPTYALPKLDRADLRSAAVNASEQILNRTEPIYNAIMWPLMYFFGGPSCHVLLDSPVIRGVRLPMQPNEATQVCETSTCRTMLAQLRFGVSPASRQGILVCHAGHIGTDTYWQQKRQGAAADESLCRQQRQSSGCWSCLEWHFCSNALY